MVTYKIYFPSEIDMLEESSGQRHQSFVHKRAVRGGCGGSRTLRISCLFPDFGVITCRSWGAWLLVSALLVPVVSACESLVSGPSSPEISSRG